MSDPIVFVVASARYGSAIMRGHQQAQSVNAVGGAARVFSASADRPSLFVLREQTVVLVKDVILDDELILALALGGNRLVWDAVDWCAHKPAIALPESPAEHLAGRAATELIGEVLAMTAATAAVVDETFTGVHTIHRVDHQVDVRLRAGSGMSTAERFSAAYFGAPENLPDWADGVSELQRLLTSPESFAALVERARTIPVHADMRNATRDRRDHKPWTKVATTLALGAVPIAENTAANLDVLGPDYPLLFDGSSIDFERCLTDAERLWTDGSLTALRSSLDPLRVRSDPHTVARALVDALDGVRSG